MNAYAPESLPLRCGKKLVSSALCAAALAVLVQARGDPEKSPEANLGDLSIEQLMNESVTSVSKKEQRLLEAAAAISVLSNDDLRRSGTTSLADALRLVPGMDVGLIDANQWAISARGFQGLYANKLLVLIDGRAVYSPLFAGVYWDVQQTLMEDVDRIEVIRGPGATVWGANAVNGVINVETKSARDTQGGYLFGGAGDIHLAQGGMRFGGKIGDNTYYRLYSDYHLVDDYPTAAGTQGGDGWSVWQGGLRVDSYPDAATHFTNQAEVTAADLSKGGSNAYNAHGLTRWTRTLSDGSSVEGQAYFDHSLRDETSRAHTVTDIFDATLQQTLGLSAHNELTWGLGYRHEDTRVKQTNPFIEVLDGSLQAQLFNAFVQDELKLIPDRLTLTVGTKLEHNDFTGCEIQPSLRVLFHLAPQQAVWAAVSRAVRTPDDLEGKDIFAITQAPLVIGATPYFATIYGNPEARSEVLWAYEAGYRVQASSHVSLDAALFYNDYRGLLNPEFTGRLFPNTGPVPGTGRAEQFFVNALSGETYGGEAILTMIPTDDLRLTASYSLLIMKIHGLPTLDAETLEQSSPVHQASLRCNYDFAKRASVDVTVRYVGGVQLVPAYTTADLRLSCRLTNQLELILVGQNLLDHQHPEQPPAPGPALPLTEVPRNFYGQVIWRF